MIGFTVDVYPCMMAAGGRHLGKLQRHRAVSMQQHGFLVNISVKCYQNRSL